MYNHSLNVEITFVLGDRIFAPCVEVRFERKNMKKIAHTSLVALTAGAFALSSLGMGGGC